MYKNTKELSGNETTKHGAKIKKPDKTEDIKIKK